MTATTIQIAEDALEKMDPSEIEEYIDQMNGGSDDNTNK